MSVEVIDVKYALPHWLDELHFLLLMQKSLRVPSIMIYDESVSMLNSANPT